MNRTFTVDVLVVSVTAVLEVYQFARDAAVAEAWLIGQEPYLLSQELGVSTNRLVSAVVLRRKRRHCVVVPRQTAYTGRSRKLAEETRSV